MHFQLALSITPMMTFEDVRVTFKKLFVDSGHLQTGECDSTVKVEQLVSAKALYTTCGRGRWCGSSGRDRAPSGNKFANKDHQTNSFKAGGSVSLCEYYFYYY